MIIETAVLTGVTEFLRPYLKRIFFRKKNNKRRIYEMKHAMPTFETVGELRELLEAFSDDTPTVLSDYERPHIQIVDWIGEGRITFGMSVDYRR